MWLPWQDQHPRWHALSLECVVELVALGDWHAHIRIALLNHCRRGDAFDMEHRRVLLIAVHDFPRLAAEIVGHKRRDIRRAVETHQVCHWCTCRRRFEALCLSDDPGSHKATVTPTHDPETIGVCHTHLDNFI